MTVRFHALPRPVAPATVSVVVPCYNYGHYLRPCVDSILGQEDVDTEVIIVDDASPDGSGDVAREIAAADPRVTAVVHDINARHIATYNDGLARARGEAVLLLSADDLLAPGALARAVGILQRFPSVALVYGFAPSFDVDPPAPRRVASHCTVWPGPQWLARVARSGQNPVSTPTAVLRGDVARRIGGYDASLPHTADLLMWLQAAAAGDVAYVNGTDQGYYRVHGANMHTTHFADLIADLEQRLAAFRVAAESLSPAQAAVCVPAAARALAREALTAARRLDRRPSAAEQQAAADLRRFASAAVRAAGAPPSRAALLAGAPSGVTAAADAAGWRYWRRFGLRP